MSHNLLLCFCVGDATEKKARISGFQNVISAEGNVENLKELILRNFDKKNGKLIYVSGEKISIDLDQQLSKEGYDIKRIINNQILEDWVKDKAKEVYKEEKEKEIQEIINQANRREGKI